MKITDYIKDHTLYLDGGTGTLLQAAGLAPGELPERWNISHPEVLTELHRSYYDAGSNVVSANTFGANCLKFSEEELEAIIEAAMDDLRAARDLSTGKQPKWMALDIGPTGRMLKPYGDLDFEDAVEIFAKTVRLAVKYGAELIFIQTMNDSYETKAALLAVKENCDLPVFVGNAYGEDGKLMTGASPAAMVAMLEGMGADAIGVNCSLGPRALRGVVDEYLRCSSLPVIVKANAGLPRVEEGRTVYDVPPREFAADVADMVSAGVRVIGGCCGTTPEYISALVRDTENITPVEIAKKNISVVSSYTHAVTLGERPIIIGERINPTGKKRFKEALRAGDMDYILREGLEQAELGAHVLDVNVGLPEIDEAAMLCGAVESLQAVCDLPLQIDTSDPVAMERAMRRYNGKAMVNSVNGKEESMRAVFPLVKKYGGLVVALTLDESGIPDSAEKRLEIARRILAFAAEYGIEKKDIVFDPLALTVSADGGAAMQTLGAVGLIRRELGAHTSLGVSNVSFGLPQRDIINGSFLTLAMGQGLSAAIMNPRSAEMMKAYHAYCALAGLDDNCAEYIGFAQDLPTDAPSQSNAVPQSAAKGGAEDMTELQEAIYKGLRDRAAALTDTLLDSMPPLEIVQSEVIPALDKVGVGFEKKRVYLPGLLMSAEAAKAAFEKIKERVPGGAADKCAVIIATVKGDIHDIGKNIVKLLLENYGFAVTDLGRDVSPESVLDEVIRQKAPLVGLSALMTTTVPAMEETVRLIHERAPWCRVMVGGAVMTPEYAERIGADGYAKDAMGAVRLAEEINSKIKKGE